MRSNKKIQLNNVLLILCICLFVNILTVPLIAKTSSVTQTQTVSINSPENEKVNLNTATKEQLKSLPTIGDTKANAIIENRPYSSVYDLNKIENIGEGTINSIKELVTCQ